MVVKEAATSFRQVGNDYHLLKQQIQSIPTILATKIHLKQQAEKQFVDYYQQPHAITTTAAEQVARLFITIVVVVVIVRNQTAVEAVKVAIKVLLVMVSQQIMMVLDYLTY